MSRAADLIRPYEQRDLLYVAIPRTLAIPLFLGLLSMAGDELDAGIWIVASIALIYSLATLWSATSPHWARVDARVMIAIDLVAMAAAVVASGGPGTPAQSLFYVWTIVMSLLFPPRVVLGCAAGAVGVYAAASIPFAAGDAATLRQVGVTELTLAWIGLVTYLVADSFQRRQHRIGRLSEARRSLLADALSAEDRARRRLSQSLHDDALQTLLAAGQDLDGGITGERGHLERARAGLRSAVAGLRKTIRGLHPAALEHGGLSGGLDAVVEDAAGRGGFTADLRVDPEAGGWHDALIVSVVRELVTNAVKHAEASRLSVQIDRRGDAIGVEVSDDGRGMLDASRDTALAAGHIGLASALERIEAAGGSMRIASAPDQGTRISISLPTAHGENGRGAGANGLVPGRAGSLPGR